MCLKLFIGAMLVPPAHARQRKSSALRILAVIPVLACLRTSGELERLRTGYPGGCLRGAAFKW